MTNAITNIVANANDFVATELSPEAITAINYMAANQPIIIVSVVLIVAILVFKS